MIQETKPILESRPELFVRGIDSKISQKELEDFFSQFAPVKHCTIVKDSNGESKGFGFVGFGDKIDAESAQKQSNKKKLNGKPLLVEFAQPRSRRGDVPKKAVETVEKRRPRLIIRNLPWSIRDKGDVEKIFSKYGKVLDAYIPRGKGGKMSGFAFVTMKKNSSAKKAIEETKDLSIGGRKVTVDFALEKNKYLAGEKVEDESDGSSDEEDGEGKEMDDESDEEVGLQVFDGDEESDEEEGESDDDEEENEAEEDNEAEKAAEQEDSDDEEELDDETGDQSLVDPTSTAPNQTQPKRRPASNSSTIFVRNIPYDATSEDLQDHFEQFGPVRYALPVFDKKLNQPKGVAFVAFKNDSDCIECINKAPASTSNGSLLLAEDADPRYVFEGRILSVSAAVDRDRADDLSRMGKEKRGSAQGRESGRKDKRNIFLLNEGRITAESKSAVGMPASELEIREKSYQLRKKQLEKNPSLHLSLTRLAIRNLPRAMNGKALKALGRKAIVEFAKEVKEKKRLPLSKEEILFSVKATEKTPSKHGVVKQAKIITEHKASGELGRSRGYGFLEFKNHKSALMGLRWLNAHLVTRDEIVTGYTEEELKHADLGDVKKRRLVVEFALENAQVVHRRREHHDRDKAIGKRKREEEKEKEEKSVETQVKKVKKVDNPVNHIIGKKRRERRKGK